jgi:hypothetical protein
MCELPVAELVRLHALNRKLQEEENDELRLQMATVHKKLDDLLREVSKISLREAMRVLEKYYVFDVLGSKNQMRV